ncbi:MAG TPA: hypothetical protein VFB20_07420 [Burkholderiales bacterium]|nr:hypothetical protein [Burkholderiales bacterium]
MTSTHTCLSLGILLLAVGLSARADVPKEGRFDYKACYAGPHHMTVHAKDQMGGAYEVYGMQLAEPNQLFYNLVELCLGSWTLIKGEYAETGSCEFTDPAGDKFFVVYSRKNQEDGVWRAISGTGKYDGIVLSGNWMPFTQFSQPPGQVLQCNRNWGSYKLR